MANPKGTRYVKENSIVLVIIDYGGGDIEAIRTKLVTESMHEDSEISVNSPIGKAIFHKKEGDVVSCKLPNGENANVTIKKIEI